MRSKLRPRPRQMLLQPKIRQRLKLRRLRSLLIRPRSSKSRKISRKLHRRRLTLSTTKTPKVAAVAVEVTKKKMTRISLPSKMANFRRSTDQLAAAAKNAKRTPSIKS